MDTFGRLVVLAVTLMTGCGGDTQFDELRKQKSAWQALTIDNYAFAYLVL